MPGDREPEHFEVRVLPPEHRHVLHEDDIPWYEAPLPRRWHRCRVQTSGVVDGRWVERCACGAIRVAAGLFGRPAGWMERNSRRKRRG